MRLDTSQSLRLEQRMKLAPRMIQSMEILQLPLLALQERIEQELISNPVLELREPTADEPPADRDDDADELPESEKTLVVRDQSRPDDFQRMNDIAENDDFDDYYSQGRGSSIHVAGGERDRKLDAMANTAARDVSLHEYLTFQWALVDADDGVRNAGQAIINNLEDDGYLRAGLDSLVEGSHRHPFTLAQAERALVLVQRLEPPGVGARDLQECLLLQLDTVQSPPAIHALARILAEDHLPDIEANRLPAIARATRSSIEQVQDAIRYLHRFDPRPGHQIGATQAPYVLPDVIIDYSPNGDGYEVRLAGGNEPALYINRVYRRMLRNGHVDSNTRDFIKRNIQSARWLIESLEQRRSTLLRVAREVTAAQHDFLDNGPQHLKPLPMSAVAQRLGVHVATVSRAVSEKYVQTPRGIYPLRQFFSMGVQTQAGESLSWGAVKAKIKELVEREDKTNPLSDDQIVAQLKADGIDVARRTVAKYRKVLHIPATRQRREFN